MNIPASGGYRVKENGLIKVLEDSIVIWGLHNNICWKDRVSKGYVFNDLDTVGSWHDVVPMWKRIDNVYFERIGNSIPATKVDNINKSNKIKIKRIYTKPYGSYWN